MNRAAGRAVIVAVVLGGVAIGALFPLALDNTARERSAEKAQAAAVRSTAPGGLMALVDRDGKMLSADTIRGRVLLIVLTDQQGWRASDSARFEIEAVLRELGPTASRLLPVLVDLAPDRSQVAALAEEARALRPDALALGGDAAAIAALTRAYGITNGAQAGNPAARVYLMDGEGRFRGVLEPAQGRAFWLDRLRELTPGG